MVVTLRYLCLLALLILSGTAECSQPLTAADLASAKAFFGADAVHPNTLEIGGWREDHRSEGKPIDVRSVVGIEVMEANHRSSPTHNVLDLTESHTCLSIKRVGLKSPQRGPDGLMRRTYGHFRGPMSSRSVLLVSQHVDRIRSGYLDYCAARSSDSYRDQQSTTEQNCANANIYVVRVYEV